MEKKQNDKTKEEKQESLPKDGKLNPDDALKIQGAGLRSAPKTPTGDISEGTQKRV